MEFQDFSAFPLEKKLDSPMYPLFNKLQLPMTDRVERFLKHRSIDPGIAKRFGVGEVVRVNLKSEVSGEERDAFDRWNGFLIRNHPALGIPLYTDSGEVIAFQLRSLNSKSFCNVFTDFAKFYVPVFGVAQQRQELQRLRAAVLVEGVMDALALMSVFDIPVISGLSASMSTAAIDRVAAVITDLIGMFDNDIPGKRGFDKISKYAQHLGVRAFSVEYQAHDPNDVVMQGTEVHRVGGQLSAFFRMFAAMHS